MEIFTIGFAQTPAAEFFGKLKRARVRRLLDVRLNNTSQLAGYAKRDHLEFFSAATGRAAAGYSSITSANVGACASRGKRAVTRSTCRLPISGCTTRTT
jgi:uncharacterized protein (DUF488 family)